MKLIIYANPKEKGHCFTVLQEVKKFLATKKVEFDVLDLYAMNFNPVLKNENINAEGHIVADEEVKSIQQKIKNSNDLIFIYPNWWAGMPAMLKGFFDRVFTDGFALEFKGMVPKGLLKTTKATVFITAGGPKIAHLLMGNRTKKIIKKDILGFSGIKTKVVLIGSCMKFIEDSVPRIKDIVKKNLK
jgi:NAD(P)H dehydrogenase (quinone)